MRTSSGPVQSIDRVLDILEALSSAPLGMSLSDLAAATGLHVSTAHRLVHALAERGYAMKEPSGGKYRLTLRTFEIGSRVSGVWNLLSAAKPYLDELASASREAVHLVERDGNGVVYLYKAEPFQQLVRIGSYTGLRNPMYCTGVGKSILALLPEEQLEALWETQELITYTPNTITELDTMKQELAATRQRGYAMDNEEHELGVRCIAMAVRSWAGEPVGAVSISAPAARLEDEEIRRLLPQLQYAASQISHMLGWRE